ncbi:hypothetical protein DF153_22590, partial [Burkholderia cenocepacia]
MNASPHRDTVRKPDGLAESGITRPAVAGFAAAAHRSHNWHACCVFPSTVWNHTNAGRHACPRSNRFFTKPVSSRRPRRSRRRRPFPAC